MSPPAQSGRNELPTFLRGIAPLDTTRTTQRVVPAKDSVKMRPQTAGVLLES
jgi:hypothetical protein